MLDIELKTAIEAVRTACGLCRSVRESLVSEETVAKGDRSPVTVADFGAQAVIIAYLRQAFGDVAIVAEEDAALLRSDAAAELRGRVAAYVRGAPAASAGGESAGDNVPDFGAMSEGDVLELIDGGGYAGGEHGRFWTLDPIDGTKGFISGDRYAVALALIEEGKPVLGVLGCPNLPEAGLEAGDGQGVILVAVRGAGAFQESIAGGERSAVTVSSRGDTAKAVFCESVESAHTAHGRAAAVADRLGVTAEPARLDSQCKYAVTARGDADVYLRLPTRPGYEEKIWDHAAGAVIVEVAGGRVTDVAGLPLDFACGRTLCRNRGVVATNGALHDAVITALS